MARVTSRRSKPPCAHDYIPVESSGKLVAWLCLTCDAQLPADYAMLNPPPEMAGFVRCYWQRV